MRVKFSNLDFNERPVLVLKNLDGTAIQVLGYAFNIEFDPAYNEVSELTFDIPAEVDGMPVPGYENVVGMRIVDMVGIGQFLLVDPEEVSDGIRTVKSCKAYSLEYEFAKKDIYLEAGTYNFFSGIDTSDENTIVGRIRERLPDWRFNIDPELIGRYRTFDDTNKKVYDFIKSDVQEKYGCIFDFDTYERIVHIVDVTSIVPTKQVYLSKDNLIKEINTNEDSDSVVTCLDVYGADDVTIRSVNPTGLNKIFNLDWFMTETNFSSDFISRWRKWEKDCEDQQSKYYDITVAYNMKLLEILTAEADIADLKAQLTAKENVQAATIQGIAQDLKDQGDLNNVNADIASLRSEISFGEDSVASLKEQAKNIHKRREDINAALAFENYFSAEEITVLKRYFIEDTLQDDSFVAETAATYIEEDYSAVVNGSSVSISGAKDVTKTTDVLGCTVYSVTGGSLSVGSMTGKIIKATLYCNSDGTAVFSAYSDGGTVGEAAFSTGNVTVSGNYSGITSGSTSLSFEINNGRLYFTEKCTEYKRLQIEWDLYAYAKQLLAEKSTPTYNFKVDACNFLSVDDFKLFKNQLELGKRVYLDLDKEVLTPYVVAMHCSFDDPTDFSIEFSSSYSSFDKSFALAKLLEQSVSMGKTLNYKSGAFSAFVNSGASTAVKDFMDSALDISKNAVLSSQNQAITFDDTGIRIRKWNSDKTGYEPEEIWIVDNVIAFTNDNWATAKMAIGKIFDPNLQSNANPTGMAYGIVADYLVGKILAGQNLIIQATALDGDTVTFRVDGSGAYLYNADINVVSNGNQVTISPDHGIAIGTYPLYTVGSDDKKSAINENNAKFWVDAQGNLHLKGSLEGCNGTFSGKLEAASGTFSGELSAATGTFSGKLNAATGTFNGDISAASGTFKGKVQASDFLDSSGNSMMNNNKFDAEYLDLRGITIRDSSNNVTFSVSETGAVTINGKVTMSSGSSISWGSITGVPATVTGAYSLASSAAADAESAYDMASNAETAAEGAVNTVSGWKYEDSTYIDGAKIMTGTVMASQLFGGEIGLLDDDENWVGGLYLGGAQSADYAVELYSNEALRLTAGDGDLYLSTDSSFLRIDESGGVYIGSGRGALMAFRPASDNDYELGGIDNRWLEIYAVNDVINTSDAREKKNIEYDMDKYENFFLSLKPTQYKFIDNNSERYHIGFISQDVESSLLENNLSSFEFAGFIKTPLYDADNNLCDYRYGLRYGEFTALNTYMIQKLYKRIDELENKIIELKGKYEE